MAATAACVAAQDTSEVQFSNTYDAIPKGVEGDGSGTTPGWSMSAEVSVDQLYQETVPKLTWKLNVIDGTEGGLLQENYQYQTYA